MTLLRRSLRIEVRASEDGKRKPVRIIASTSAPVERWGYVEILDHNPEAIRLAAVSLLKNHNPDIVVGRILRSEIIDGRIECDVEFAPTAAGQEEEQLVRGGFVVGASVGYSIEETVQTERADGMIEVRATRWTWRELSTTPTPADLDAGVVRAEGDNAEWLRSLNLPDRRSLSKPAAPAASPESVPMTIPTTPPTPDANARAAVHLETLKLARSHGVELADADLDKVDTVERGVRLVLERKSASEVSKPGAPVGAPTVEIVRDGAEKMVDEAIAGLASGRRISDVVRHFAKRRGMTELAEAGADDVFDSMRAALGKLDTRGLIGSDGKFNYRATLLSANFGGVTQLAAAKAVHDGYASYEAEYLKWCREYFVPDFNTVTIEGLGLSNLAAAGGGEGAAYADGSLEIAGGSGSNEFLGANYDVSFVALYNDRAGQILDAFKSFGRIGARTIDEITQAALEAASFANATQALAFSETNLGTIYAAHAGVTIKGVKARRLIVPAGLWVAAMNATIPAAGATAGRVLAGRVEVVEGAYLTDPNDWYLTGDPADAPAVAVLRHPDYQAPRIVAKGESGAPAQGMRIDFPAKAVLLTKATGKPLCAYKATVT
jgi:hypothetical protein